MWPPLATPGGISPSKGYEAMVAGGFLRPGGAAGLFTFLPLGLRVLDRIISLMDREMRSIGGEKITLPLLTPHSQWVASGRAPAKVSYHMFLTLSLASLLISTMSAFIPGSIWEGS